MNFVCLLPCSAEVNSLVPGQVLQKLSDRFPGMSVPRNLLPLLNPALLMDKGVSTSVELRHLELLFPARVDI